MLYSKRHPYLEEFGSREHSSLFKIEVETYCVVTRFQQVDELRIKSGSRDQLFVRRLRRIRDESCA